MARGDTARFLQLLNEQNERIAARIAQEQKEEESRGEDPIRLARMQERRDRLGQLRAREHTSKRPKRATHIFGRSDIGTKPIG